MNRKKYLIYCIFGGWFGLHKFITKQYGIGFIYLFTLGLFYVGWFYDIYIAYKIYKSNNNLNSSFNQDYKYKYVNGYTNKNGKYIKGYYRK